MATSSIQLHLSKENTRTHSAAHIQTTATKYKCTNRKKVIRNECIDRNAEKLTIYNNNNNNDCSLAKSAI